MAWITLAQSNVLDRLSETEHSSYEAAAGADDRLAGIMDQVTNLVRGKVSACSENIAKMGAVGTIPDELLWAACTICRHSLIASLPTFDGVSDARNDELTQAYKQLDDAASCSFGIADTDGESTDSVGVYGGNDLLEF